MDIGTGPADPAAAGPIITKITKTGATRCQIVRPKCTKLDFSWGFAPDPAGRAYSAHPDP